jgi:formylglycine-generating enzyme required for sulfatase activity
MQFPIDESPLGAYDFCGSAMEWLDDWYDFGRGMRRLGGGGWGQSMGHVLTVAGGLGAPPEATSGETGMRLLARPSGGGGR